MARSDRVMFIDWKMHFYSIPERILQNCNIGTEERERKKRFETNFALKTAIGCKRNRIIRFAASRTYAFGN